MGVPCLKQVRYDGKLIVALGHQDKMSSLFVETVEHKEDDKEQRDSIFAVLGNLNGLAKRHGVQWLPEFPLFEPRLNHLLEPAQPPVKDAKPTAAKGSKP